MATQTTGGGSTTSFINSPQAVDDSYCYTEDALRNSSLYNATTKAVTLDVMSDDLGGSAKSLFSIDDGNGNVLEPDFELLCKDVNTSGCSAWEKTPDGNWIRINNGKIEFKLGNPEYPDDPTRALDLNSLGTDRSVDDEFVYAIRLANGTLSQATVHIHITGENDAVELGAVTDATINDTAANDAIDDILGKLTSSDVDFGDTPTYGLGGSVPSDDSDYQVMKVTAYGTLYLNTETGDYKFVANNAAIQELDSDDATVALDFSVSVTDGGTTVTDTLTITIDGANDTPELAAVTGATINDGTGNDSFTDITGTLIGSDRDAAETLTYGLMGAVESTDPAFDWMKVTPYGTLYLDKDTGAYKFVANNAAINGLDSDDAAVVLNFALSVSDGDASDSKTLTITLNGANDTPVLTGTAAALPNGVEDNAYTVTKAQLLEGWTDADEGETLSITDFAASNGTVTANADGSYTITPAANFNGSVTLSYNISDGTDAVPASLSYTLISVNDAPAGTDKTVATLEDTAVTLAVADFGFTDPSDSPANALLAVKITALPSSGTLTLDGAAVAAGQSVLATDIAAGKLVYTPALNATTDATFTFQVQDNGGTANGGADLDPSANTLTIDITPVNDAPAGTDKTVTTPEDTAIALATADFGFTDPSDGPADALLAVKIIALPASGSLTLDGTAVTAGQSVLATDIAAGKLLYTPALNATADATFTFQVQDNGGTANGGIDLDPSANTLTIDITPVNDAPEAATVSLGSYHEDGLRTITPAELLAGASDVDGDPLEITGLEISSGGGTLYPNEDGTWFYRPEENTSGPVSFTYTVSDGELSASGAANLTILPANDPPFLDLSPDPDTNAATLDYTAGDGTVVIAPGAAVTDVDSPDFGGGYMTVGFAQGGTPADTLAIRNQGTAAGQIGVSGGNVTYGGVIIGTFSGGAAGTQLSINFNANATQAAITALLENITFATTATGASSKEVHFWVNDGDGTDNFGWDTNGAVAFINVEPGDVLAPTDIQFALNPSTATLTGNGLGTAVTLGSFAVVDADSSSWTFDLTPTGTVPPAVDVSIVGGVVNLVTTGPVSTGKYTFSVTVTDGGGNERTEHYTLSVGSTGTDLATAFTITNADSLDPNTGTDISLGLNGGDTINGGSGDDAIVGGQSVDRLNGQLGNDQLIGGNQNDFFRFDTNITAAPNVDLILDMDAGALGGPGGDKIELDDAIFTGLTTANLAANFQSSATGTFTGTAKLQFNSSTGELWYDADGAAGPAAAILFADITLLGGSTLDPTDFIIV